MNVLKPCGAVVFWNLSECWRSSLLDAWDTIGYKGLVPEPRTPQAVLRSALSTIYRGGHSVEPLAKKNGFAVAKVYHEDDEVRYEHLLSIRIVTRDDGTVSLETVPYSHSVAFAVSKEYNRECDVITPNALSKALVEVIKNVNGITLRPGGGCYWIPDQALEVWEKLGKLTSRCGVGLAPQVYTIRHHFDRESVVAVLAAVVQELKNATETIRGEVTSGELGKRALQSRQESVEALWDLAEFYERHLGVALTESKAAISELSQMTSAAALLEMAIGGGD